jgi:hypothetical protein
LFDQGIPNQHEDLDSIIDGLTRDTNAALSKSCTNVNINNVIINDIINVHRNRHRSPTTAFRLTDIRNRIDVVLLLEVVLGSGECNHKATQQHKHTRQLTEQRHDRITAIRQKEQRHVDVGNQQARWQNLPPKKQRLDYNTNTITMTITITNTITITITITNTITMTIAVKGIIYDG